MIYSENRARRSVEFAEVLDGAVALLKTEAAADSERYLASGGTRLESLVCEAISAKARGTEFEGSISLVSGQRFPDLISRGGFGVEVKSTTQNHWTTVGNSVLESTRVEDVDRIFLLFGKLARPIDFKVRPYEDCMADVVVSHYPRYAIDMQLGKGETIFDKINRTYDDVRTSDSPVKLFARYYRSQLSSGGELWWAGGGNDDIGAASVPFMVKMWSDESVRRRVEIQAQALVLFPEILGTSTTKYDAFAMWLIREHGIISTHVRDIFTAGGQVGYRIGRREFRDVRKVVGLTIGLRQPIVDALNGTSRKELAERWGSDMREGDRCEQWIELLAERKYVRGQELDLMRAVFLDPSARAVGL